MKDEELEHKLNEAAAKIDQATVSLLEAYRLIDEMFKALANKN